MEAITRHNYESFFLDFAEGNISNTEREAVLAFVAANPDLAEELEAFEIIEIAPDTSSEQNWASLKKAPESSLESLFFKSVEGNISHTEQLLLDKQLEKPEHQKAFAYWKQTVLQPDTIEIDKDPFYHLELVLPIGAHNYEHFLIAKSEGLLSEMQAQALLSYAATQPSGDHDLRVADALRLQPAKGIFYPDKKALYKKERKGIVLFYQAAAVAAILVLGAFLFNMQDNTIEAPALAHKDKNPVVKQIDSLELKEEKKDTNEINLVPVVPIEEWEMREPDPSFVAEQLLEPPVEKEQESQEDIELITEAVLVAEEIPVVEDEPFVPTEVVVHPNQHVESTDDNDIAEGQPQPEPQKEEYKSVPEFTEDVLASRLNIPDDERDQMALAIAKKVTDKATSMLDSEIKREESDNGDQLTYTLRIKKFKIQHSRKR